jgi:hypothetical protein
VKNQYFGDRRDLFKYDLLADLAGCLPDSRLVFIPMLTPNDDSGEGGLIAYGRGTRRGSLVDALRDAVASGIRDIQTLRNLMPSFGVQFMPHRDASYFPDVDRVEYFAAVPTQWLAASVVFFDPDIGLQTGTVRYMRGKGAEKYLLYSDLRAVLERATDSSVFVVYQHLQKDATKRAGDLQRRLRDLTTQVGVSVAWAIQWGDVAFLVMVRDGAVASRVRLTLGDHARQHQATLSEMDGQPGVPETEDHIG